MFVRLDLHKNYPQAAVTDDQSRFLSQERIPNKDENIEEFARRTLTGSYAEIVIESSSTWYHVYELLSRKDNCQVVLSNPVKTKATASARVKTDKIDALTLANLPRGGYIREPKFPPGVSWTSARWSGIEHPW